MMPQKDFLPLVSSDLQALFQTQGMILLGVSSVESQPQREAYYKKWLAQGYQGEMEYLSRHGEMKYHPEKILEGCRSVLVVGLNYYQEGAAGPGEGRVARYAWGRDYHKVLGTRLKKMARALEETYLGHQFRGFTDAVPLDERYFAQNGGLGFMGRNNLIISSLYGSWFFLGEILSTRPWEETPLKSPVHGACPQGCKKCLNVCPTGALKESNVMDASLCISYLTIEFKGSIPLELRRPMGDWVFGCDLCQEVCPFQLRKKISTDKDFLAWKAGPGISLKDLLTMESDEFLKRFAGSPVMRAGLRMMKRNACIAAGNLKDPESRIPLQNLALSEDVLISEHAQWALAQYKEIPQ